MLKKYMYRVFMLFPQGILVPDMITQYLKADFIQTALRLLECSCFLITTWGTLIMMELM